MQLERFMENNSRKRDATRQAYRLGAQEARRALETDDAEPRTRMNKHEWERVVAGLEPRTREFLAEAGGDTLETVRECAGNAFARTVRNRMRKPRGTRGARQEKK